MDSYFDRWDKKLDEISDEMRKMDEHVTRLEHRARQPRLAMEANGQASTKTRKRTEGATTAVQAMRGDGFSARRVKPGPNTNLTSFGVKAEPPALPCRDDVVVERGAAASGSCLPSLKMRPSLAAGGLIPTGKASTASETTSNEPFLLFYVTEEIQRLTRRWEIYGLRLHPPRTTAAASGDCLLLHTATGSSRPNQGKIGPLIQAVLEVTSAPARFWDRGVRWFVTRFYGLGQLEMSCSVFSKEIRWLFAIRPVMMLCQEKVSPSRVARGYTNRREKRMSRRHGD